jgi:hypothetical protein
MERFMQLRGIVYHQIILNALERKFRAIFVFCGKVRLLSTLMFVFAIYGLHFDSLLQELFAKPFFLGDEYIVYYIQGLTSPTTAAREGTMVYLRVIIIWELLQMLNFQYKKSDLLG